MQYMEYEDETDGRKKKLRWEPIYVVVQLNILCMKMWKTWGNCNRHTHNYCIYRHHHDHFPTVCAHTIIIIKHRMFTWSHVWVEKKRNSLLCASIHLSTWVAGLQFFIIPFMSVLKTRLLQFSCKQVLCYTFIYRIFACCGISIFHMHETRKKDERKLMWNFFLFSRPLHYNTWIASHGMAYLLTCFQFLKSTHLKTCLHGKKPQQQ